MNFVGGNIIQFSSDDGHGGTSTQTGFEAIEAISNQLSKDKNKTSVVAVDSTVQATVENTTMGKNVLKVMEGPGAFEASFLSTMPKAMFLMVPLAALLFKFMYFRQKRPYLHFLVFALHLHALLYLTFSLSILAGKILPGWLGTSLVGIFLLSFPINAIRAQRRTFHDSWFKATLKAGLVWHVYGLFLLVIISGVSTFTLWNI